jgi:hypothetical protein
MLSFNHTLKIDQGASVEDMVIWQTGTPPLPVDLTGCTAIAQIRSKIDSPNVLLELSTANGGIVLGGATGSITMHISPIVTKSLTWKLGVYDLLITFTDGTVLRKLNGSVIVSQSVTR